MKKKWKRKGTVVIIKKDVKMLLGFQYIENGYWVDIKKLNKTYLVSIIFKILIIKIWFQSIFFKN